MNEKLEMIFVIMMASVCPVISMRGGRDIWKQGECIILQILSAIKNRFLQISSNIQICVWFSI
jgi:hypothetical protein